MKQQEMKTILLLDNNHHHKEFLAEVLKDQCFNVLTSKNADHVIEQIAAHSVDLIVGDIFIDELIWQRVDDILFVHSKDGDPIPITFPVLYYSPADVTKVVPDIFRAVYLADGLICSSVSPEDILSAIHSFIIDFDEMSELVLQINKRKVLEAELHDLFVMLKHVLNVGKLNAWQWNLSTRKVNDFGYLPSISHPDGYYTQGSIDWFLDSLHNEDRDPVGDKLEQTANDGTYFDMEFRIDINGSMEWISSQGMYYYDSMRRHNKCIGVWRNISELKENEQLIAQQKYALSQVQRINSLGEITSTLSHQLSQPLHIMKSYVGGCIRRLENDISDRNEILDAMQSVSNCVDMIADIVRNMKNFIRKGEVNHNFVNINNIILASVKFFSQEFDRLRIKLIMDLCDDEFTIEADEIQLQQVILNIVQNSIDSLVDSRTRDPFIQISTRMDDDWIKVSVIDNGPGIPASHFDNVFLPYFTTKSEGMGVGLKVARYIVEAHGGKIMLNKTFEPGASISFTLAKNIV